MSGRIEKFIVITTDKHFSPKLATEKSNLVTCKLYNVMSKRLPKLSVYASCFAIRHKSAQFGRNHTHFRHTLTIKVPFWTNFVIFHNS